MAARRVGDLAVTIEGEGPAIVFVAGLGGLGSYWRRQMATFAASHRVITFDHRGLGGSAATPPPYSVEGWADDVRALADALGLKRFAFVGHSTGGAIGQVFAARHSERLSALVLSGTWAKADLRFREVFALRKILLEQVGAGAYDALGAVLTRPLVWGPAEGPLAASASPPPMDVVLGRIDALIAHDATALLPAISTPTLVCAAADDLLVTPNLSRALAAGIPGARFELVADGGHHFPQTRPDAFEALLRGFLAAA